MGQPGWACAAPSAGLKGHFFSATALQGHELPQIHAPCLSHPLPSRFAAPKSFPHGTETSVIARTSSQSWHTTSVPCARWAAVLREGPWRQRLFDQQLSSQPQQCHWLSPTASRCDRWTKARENLGAGKAEPGSRRGGGGGHSCCHIHHLLGNRLL